MRFDDRLHTASVMEDRDVAAAAPRWIHLVDILAQSHGLSGELRERALIEARRIAPAIPDSIKRSAALAIAARITSVDLVALFAAETPRIAAPVLLNAMLSDREWQLLIPRLAPPIRALLRERRNLPQRAIDGLAAFGPSDFTLADDRDPIVRSAEITPTGHFGEVATGAEPGVSQISDLVAKIETWRSRKDLPKMAIAEPVRSLTIAAIDKFQFETNDLGVIDWISGAPRAIVIGISLATLADPVCPGVDGQTAGAFAKRADIRDGRMMLATGTSLSGLWRVEARPLFAPDTGKFAGYVGVSRRATGAVGAVADDTPCRSELLRQVIHELRSPLNAVGGFAELIEHQIAGPVGQSYRARAASIVGESRRMLSVIETLDDAAKAAAINTHGAALHGGTSESVLASA